MRASLSSTIIAQTSCFSTLVPRYSDQSAAIVLKLSSAPPCVAALSLVTYSFASSKIADLSVILVPLDFLTADDLVIDLDDGSGFLCIPPLQDACRVGA